jgi:XRE family transcriptional regulator, aerobic/anaerobic benzoate catabolism transcriptional regulator
MADEEATRTRRRTPVTAGDKAGQAQVAGQTTGQVAGQAVAPRSSADEEFLAELGQRVRRIRALRGMSRKVLAEVSDISERYVAQLESGMGNVSVLLLRRVAKAAGITLDGLIGDAPDEMAPFRDVLRTASPEAIERAKAVLRGEDTVSLYRRAVVDRVALIGLRGAGKSTLGRLAAKRLRWKFVELNREVERESGFSMAEIFRLYGQEGYRKLELKALRKICARREPMILATGGGIVSESASFELLLSSFFTIWLKAAPEEHMARVRQQGDLRPMANERAAMDDLRMILSTREPFYARAAASIDTSGKSVDSGANEILSVIASCSGAAAGPAIMVEASQPRPVTTAKGRKR